LVKWRKIQRGEGPQVKNSPSISSLSSSSTSHTNQTSQPLLGTDRPFSVIERVSSLEVFSPTSPDFLVSSENSSERNQEAEKTAQRQLQEISDLIMPDKEFSFSELKEEIKKLKSESFLSQLSVKKIELERIIASVKSELSEESKYLLTSLLKQKIKSILKDSDAAKKKLEEVEEILVKKIEREKLQNLLVKQGEVAQLKKQLGNLQEAQLQNQIQVLPKQN